MRWLQVFNSIFGQLSRFQFVTVQARRVARTALSVTGALALWAGLRKTATLDSAYFAGKKILIIGPASHVSEEISLKMIREFDLIVRMNRAIEVPVVVDGEQVFEHEVLFHNLKAAEGRSPGKITSEKILRNKTQYVIYPCGNPRYLWHFLWVSWALRKQCSTCNFMFYPTDIYRQVLRRLDGKMPTTGVAAIFYIAACNPALLYVVGFSFFRSAYMLGYDDTVLSAKDAMIRATHRGLHDPDQEAEAIRDLVRVKNFIRLGPITRKFIR